jgi:hypothetical protein
MVTKFSDARARNPPAAPLKLTTEMHLDTWQVQGFRLGPQARHVRFAAVKPLRQESARRGAQRTEANLCPGVGRRVGNFIVVYVAKASAVLRCRRNQEAVSSCLLLSSSVHGIGLLCAGLSSSASLGVLSIGRLELNSLSKSFGTCAQSTNSVVTPTTLDTKQAKKNANAAACSGLGNWKSR